ncbi:hypothetical protein, partial [Aeromonas hydrophila]|uniref:hypothetical protein n=1 Tax=Aeromonas hydrophila TaxID=644 RepID=UPI003BA0BC91
QLLAAAGVAFYSTAFSSQALFAKAFLRLPTRPFALPLAVSMEAHYRDLDHACKRVFELNSKKQFNRSTITQMDDLFSNSASI